MVIESLIQIFNFKQMNDDICCEFLQVLEALYVLEFSAIKLYLIFCFATTNRHFIDYGHLDSLKLYLCKLHQSFGFGIHDYCSLINRDLAKNIVSFCDSTQILVQKNICYFVHPYSSLQSNIVLVFLS